MNINVQGINNSFLGGGSVFLHRGLKSTEEKMERQAQRDNQVSFYEKQKENLKNMECNTVEEIAKKLDMFHSYEDQIAAVKAAYNSEQMWHILDEAKELGEKIAKAAEKMEPKTPEERLEELVEEAMGTDESEGLLEETLEDAAQMQKELQEEVQEELQKDLQEQLPEDMMQEISEEGIAPADKKEIVSDELYEDLEKEERKGLYQPIDIRL